MKLIPLTRGYFAKIDDDDYERVVKDKWRINYYKTTKLRATKVDRDPVTRKILKIHMSRFIVNAPEGMVVDHINGDTLDNRKENLRICTQLNNTRSSSRHSNNTSGYKGVCKTDQGWCAAINPSGKKKWLGSYKTKEEAARAYNEAAKKYFGKFAKLNSI